MVPRPISSSRTASAGQWQLGTVQLDYVLPERFGLEYIGPDNQPHRPVMIHRAPLGSMERFMGILIEHFAGAFPLWLAPEQVRVLADLRQGRRLLAAGAGQAARKGLPGHARPAGREDRGQDPRRPARKDPGHAGRRRQGSGKPGGLVPRPGRRRSRGDAAGRQPWRGSRPSATAGGAARPPRPRLPCRSRKRAKITRIDSDTEAPS